MRAQFVAVGAMASGLTTEPLLMRGPQTHGGGTFAKVDTSGDLNINVTGAASVDTKGPIFKRSRLNRAVQMPQASGGPPERPSDAGM
jgi:hypothetical protein